MISTDQIKSFEIVCEMHFGCYPWFLCDVTIVTWYFFCKETLVYDPHYKHVHVYIKQKLNNSARKYSI